MSVAEIQKNASSLPEKERAKLAAWLLDSLPPAAGDDASAESLEEADRRREELDSGRVQPVPEKEFWAGIDLEREQWK
jgi:putative addiction module component (TIGR02574 family)